jgi:anti-sigma regulatory factor (Ser/Thr protein kinase)
MTASEAPASSDVRGSEAETPSEVRSQFPADIRSPGEARHFVSGVMRGWGCSRRARDEAALVVTELAANAVVHAGSGFSVLLHAGGGSVRIAVDDAVPVDPALLVVRRSRGLGLVAAVTRRWGVDVTPTGKTIWADIDAMSLG